MQSPRVHRFLEVFLVGLVLGTLLLALLYAQHGGEVARVFGLSACAVEQTLGLQCPTCGGTRALASLLEGDLSRAWQYNLLVVLTLPLAAGYSILAAGLIWRGRPLKQLPVPAALPWLWLACLFTFTFLRNLG